MMSYRINLKAVHSEMETYQYSVKSDFFTQREYSPINGGALEVSVEVRKKTVEDTFRISLRIEGTVLVACDRCLDNMECPINVEETINAKFGQTEDVTDDTIVVAENEGMLDVDSLIYDYTVLAVPIHPVHPDGACSEVMVNKLNEYLVH